jgi:hypothetical protein
MARPRLHLGITTAALLLLGDRLTWRQRGAFLAGAVAVDGDHLVDYALQRRTGRRTRLVLPLHGWEYALLAVLCPGGTRWTALARAAGYGLLLHLIVDQLTNRPARAPLYSVLYRLRWRFAAEHLTLGRGDGRWLHRPWWRWF